MNYKFKYIIIFNKNGEKGCSGPYERYERFETYAEAIEFYNKLEIEDYDWSVTWKKIYEIKEVLGDTR